jgi:hypothetical protein
VGRRLEGAEVRVDRLSGAPGILTAITNGSGDFLLSGLSPGLYVLTASKDGYASATSKLNTLLQSSIALTLPPLLGEMRPGGLEAQALPDSSWALRQPKRDLLREQRAALAPVEEETMPASDVGARLDGELQHWIALGGGADAEQRTSRLDLGTRFNSPASDTLQVSALLGDRHGPRLSGAAGRADGFEQETHGYGARWERDLGGAGAMDVQFGFRSVEVQADDASAAEDASPRGLPSSAENQMWQATGRYRREISDRRHMELGVRARRLQLDTPGALAVSVLDDAGGVPFSEADSGWALDLSGREQMALRGPLSLDYGFNYHRRAEEFGLDGVSDAFIPEAGVTIASPNGPRWSAAISLALDRPQERSFESEQQAAADSDQGLLSRVGYRLGMQYPLQRLGLSLGVNATYHPYAYAPLSESDSPLAIQTPLARSLMLSEGNAESLEFGVSLEKRFRKLVAALGSQMGQVEGYMVTGYFDEIPIQQVSYNLVRYMVASARGYRPDLGTLVHLDYQRFLNNPEQDFDPSGLAYLHERLNLGLEQELPFVDLWNARWRALVALQSLHTDALRGDDLVPLRAAGVRESERRLSGGIAIRF